MIEESLLKSNYIGKDGFIWWIGQVAHRNSWFAQTNIVNPGSWGFRCKVRIVGYHPFDGTTLKDDDLPWAQIMLDPSFGSGQGGHGVNSNLTGGETVFGFFLDGDDGQQPVVVGLLHRSVGTTNIATLEAIKTEQSSRFRPFTGHPNNVVKPTQLNSRAEKPVPNDSTPPLTTVGVGTTSTTVGIGTTTESTQTSPFIDWTKLPFPYSGLSTSINWDVNIGFAYSGTNFDQEPLSKIGFSLSEEGALKYQLGDALRGVWCGIPALSTLQIEKKADITVQTSNGCQNNLIGKITQALQDFMSVTNSLDKYLNIYTDPILNIFVDIQNTIRTTARQIGGIIRLIINNFRSTIFKCIVWAFRRLVAIIIPLPKQTIVLEAMKKILDKVYCILEKLALDNIPFIENLLGDLVDRTINVPLCAAEQWTASILSNIMNSIDDLLSNVLSGLDWLVGGIGKASDLLNQASSLAAQIYSYLECTGLACKEPSVWASRFGMVPKSADDWENMVSKVNVFSGLSVGIGSFEKALSEIPLYGNNIAFSECNTRVYNPQNQDDLMPSGYGAKWTKCIPPVVKIIGDGIGAEAVPIVGDNGSIFSVEVISGGVGYTEGKTMVNIIDNSGYGSNAKAKVKIGAGGSIQSIYLTNTGGGYCKGNIQINNSNNSENSGNSSSAERYFINASPDNIFEGEQFTVNLITKNVKDNTVVPYKISGIGTDRIFEKLEGNFVVKNNSSQLVFTTKSNENYSDDVLLKISAKDISDYVAIKNKTPIKSEYELSTNKDIVERGDNFTITLTTKNVKDDSLIPYTITGIGTQDIDIGLEGTFKISSNKSILKISALKYKNASTKLMKISLVNDPVRKSVRINSYNETFVGVSTITVGCLDEIIITSPGYGYTTGDTVTDGINTWRLFVSPTSGSVYKVEPLKTPICGFTQPPNLSINTNTGVGAEVIPLMRYTPIDNLTLEEQFGTTSPIGIGVTKVVDCV